ncbi:MAG: TIGR02452 family protein [Planctomycetota bacterium]
MTNRTQRKQIAQQTVEIMERGGYELNGRRVTIADDLREAVAEARLLKPEELRLASNHPPAKNTARTVIDVGNETSLAAARRLAENAEQGGVLVLNFASAKNPGGGFLGGSQAQEESLARASGLYPTLNACWEYYEVNRATKTALYTDHMIYSPCVPVFRNDADELLPEPWLVSFLTAPAVNAGAVRRNEPRSVGQIEDVMRRRVGYVLDAAARFGHRYVVFGAWGCGVFQNDPQVIANIFAEYLATDAIYDRCFEHIAFAVLDRPDGASIEAFTKTFDTLIEGA